MIHKEEIYHQRVKEVKRTGASDIINLVKNNPLYEKEFLYCSTNKRHFLPGFASTDMEFFTEIHFNKKLKLIEDQTATQVLASLSDIEGDQRFLATPGPYIFCAFHFGPFFQIGPMLHKLGRKLAVLTEGGITHKMLHRATPEDINMHHSSKASVLLDMVSNLQQGKNILAFLDGNLGVVQDCERKSYTKLKFLGHTFYCKKGIPYLAYITKTPIIPVISYRDTIYGRIKLCFGTPIIPEKEISRETFVANTIQRCYDEFTPYLMRNPEQWAEWHSVHQYMDLSLIKSQATQGFCEVKLSQVKFNQFRYHIYYQNNTHYLFDKDTYANFSISSPLAKCLLALKYYEDLYLLAQKVPAKLMAELLGKRVLIGI